MTNKMSWGEVVSRLENAQEAISQVFDSQVELVKGDVMSAHGRIISGAFKDAADVKASEVVRKRQETQVKAMSKLLDQARKMAAAENSILKAGAAPLVAKKSATAAHA